MSYNIRYDNPDDVPNNWDNRKEKVANLISFHKPAILGTQEALYHQLDYLDQNLESYKWIGQGRKDGKKGGEFSAVFYDSHKVQLIPDSDSTIWLSETPAIPSKDWDAALPRILTWGEFEVKTSGERFFMFNTHFDHVGETARLESAKLILDTIKEIAGNAPVVLTGDFNILDSSKPYSILTSSFLTDTYNSIPVSPIGPEYTFTGFDITPPEEPGRIDYIFINDKVDALYHATISSHRGGFYPSDHLPVMVKLLL